MDPDNLFGKPPGDWTDAELSAGLAVLATERDLAAAAGEAARADRLNHLAMVLAGQRDARRAVLAEAAAAASPCTQVLPARIVRSDAGRRRDRQRRRRG